jgi:hypothetical protein
MYVQEAVTVAMGTALSHTQTLSNPGCYLFRLLIKAKAVSGPTDDTLYYLNG